MEYKKITPEMWYQLRRPLPSWALSELKHKKNGKGGFMTAIHPMAIVQRMNLVFGLGQWNQEVVSLKQHVDSEGKHTRDYIAVVKLSVPEYNISIEQAGGNNNGGDKNPTFDAGDAAKGAVTDALTKCASYLEIGAEIFSGGNIKSIPNPKKEEVKEVF